MHYHCMIPDDVLFDSSVYIDRKSIAAIVSSWPVKNIITDVSLEPSEFYNNWTSNMKLCIIMIKK